MKNIINALMAGFSISIGGFVFLSVDNKAVGALLFSVGLFLVCSMGYSLYTGKICYLFTSEKLNIRYMVVVLVGNYISALLMGWLTRLAKPGLIDVANKICDNKLNEGLLVIPLAMMCNVMIFYAVHQYANNPHEIAKYFAIVMCVVVFILCGFEHCVANMYYFAVADFTWDKYWYLLLNVIGNSIGGILAYRINELRK